MNKKNPIFFIDYIMSNTKTRMQEFSKIKLVKWHYFHQEIHQDLGPLFHIWCFS